MEGEHRRAEIPASLGQPGSHSFDRLKERMCRKRLCQISDTSRRHRGRANGIAVVGGDVDHRQGDSRLAEPVSDLYSRLAVQLDIENNADRPGEIIVILKRPRGLKEHAVVAVLPEQPLEASENARIIVNHKNESSIRQDQSLDASNRACWTSDTRVMLA
jgi:hypothetical protein